MNSRQIEVFAAVMKAGTVSRAAEILGVTQPGVSRLVAELERSLGFALFDRVRNRIWDWSDDPAPVPVAPSTVNTPAQTPVVTRELDPALQRTPNPYTPTQGIDAPNRQGGTPRATQGVDTPRINPEG